MATRVRRRFTVEPGREIFRDGEPFVAILRRDTARPTEADKIARELAAMLNKKRR